MDQVKVALRYLKRVHFWIICPLVTLLGLGGWFMAVGALDEQKEEFVSSIDRAYGDVNSWAAPHANSGVAESMTSLIDKTRNEIKEAWQNKAEQQKEVLKWDFTSDKGWDQGTKAGFLNIVEPLRPIENFVVIDEARKTVGVAPSNDLNKSQREMYRDYIQKELPRLAKIAGAAWVYKGGRLIVDDPALENAIVKWEPPSQQEIIRKHFNDKWKNSANKAGIPTTLEVLYAQEDLWVLGHLMQIIARTNEGATTRHSAAVRRIMNIDIGKEAVESDVQIVSVGEGGEKGSRQKAEPPDPAAIKNPADGRYVDNNYEPLTAEDLKKFMGNAEIDLEQAYLAVAKRIPLRMRVSMDQRFIDKLLVECANSELTVEVRQLTICLLYTSPSPRDATLSRMPSSA